MCCVILFILNAMELTNSGDFKCAFSNDICCFFERTTYQTSWFLFRTRILLIFVMQIQNFNWFTLFLF